MLSQRSTKRLILAVIALLILGYAAKLLLIDARHRWHSAGGRIGEPILPGIDINNVTKIELREGERTATLVKTKTQWVVHDPNGYPAAFDELRLFLRLLQETVVIIPRNVPPGQLDRLDLTDPADGGTGIAVELQDKAGKRLARLILGKLYKNHKNPDQVEGRYVRILDTGVIAIVRESFPDAFTTNDAWMDRGFPRTQMAKRFTRVHNGKPLWEFVRDKPGQPMTGGRGVPAHAQIDQSQIAQLEHAWAHAKFSDVRRAGDVPEWYNGDDQFEFETFEGIVYTFKMGKQTETGWLPVTLQVTEAKGAETNAERTALVKEKARFCAGWLYFIPRTTYAPITRRLAYYLKAGKQPPPKGVSEDVDMDKIDP